MAPLKVFVADDGGDDGADHRAAAVAPDGVSKHGSHDGPEDGARNGAETAPQPVQPVQPVLLAQRHLEQMSRAALLADLAAVSGVALLAVGEGPFRQRFEAGLRHADAMWLLAPAAGGLLERLSREVLRAGRILLGSRPQALRITGSRRRTAHALARACIEVVPTYAPGQRLPGEHGAWVVRPDDGAGWIDTYLFSSAAAALAWIGAQAKAAAAPLPNYVLQPFVQGKTGSLSVLCCDGAAQVLACNDQRIAMRDNQFHVLGATVNSMADADGALRRMAQAVAAAIPGLWGHVAIDFVLAPHGVVVLEVSTRLGAAYAGLHASLGCNPAALAIDLLARPAGAAQARHKPLVVSVDLAAFDRP